MIKTQCIGAMALAFGLVYSSSANAEPLKIGSGGPAGVKAYGAIKAKVESASGINANVVIAKQGAHLYALRDGAIDVMILVVNPEQLFAEAEKNDVPKLNLADYQWFRFAESTLNFLVHPENPIKTIDLATGKALLSGQAKSWKEFTDFDQPVKLITINTLKGTTTKICRHYISSDTCPASDGVVDQNGLLRLMMKHKGVIGFAGGKPTLEGFSPKVIPSAESIPMYFFAKKKAKPEVAKFLEAAKANGVTKIE